MPNAIDFQIGSKFTDLVGGAGVENLQDAIKNTAPDVTSPLIALIFVAIRPVVSFARHQLICHSEAYHLLGCTKRRQF